MARRGRHTPHEGHALAFVCFHEIPLQQAFAFGRLHDDNEVMTWWVLTDTVERTAFSGRPSRRRGPVTEGVAMAGQERYP